MIEGEWNVMLNIHYRVDGTGVSLHAYKMADAVIVISLL
jgi:hypothetical protein